MNKIFKETLVCIGGLSLIAVLAVGINGACSKEKKPAPVVNTEDNEFFYEDEHGVYHADRDCYILVTGDAREGDTYAVKYHRKNEVSDWYAFARRKHLCVHCFNEKVLKEFDKQSHNRDSIK